MVVCPRSYGRDSMMEYLGPQWVQLVKGYKYLLSDGSNISPRHSGHVARSGMTTSEALEVFRLSRIRKSLYSFISRYKHSRCWIILWGGVSDRRRFKNVSTSTLPPSISMRTPSAVLATRPFNS